MSFYATLEIVESGAGEPITIETLSEQILAILNDDGIHLDVWSDIKTAFETGKADFTVNAAYLRSLIQSIALHLPKAAFEVRACGEEIRDTWIGFFEYTHWVFDEGPWDYD